MKTTATNRKVRVLISAIRDNALIPRPEFQRRLVWSQAHKRDFLETVLMEYPFPEIYIAAGEVDPLTARGTEMLVDGQQRLTTLYQYFTGSADLQLTGSLPPYLQLAPAKQQAFLEYEVVVRDLGRLSIDEIREVFERINSTSYSLNAMEIKNARYEGEFKKFGEALSLHPFFAKHSAFAPAEIKRMNDVRFCLAVAVTCLSNYFGKDRELDRWLSEYNDEFPLRERLQSELEATFDFIERCGLPAGTRAWQKPDLFSLLVEVHRALFKSQLTLDPARVGNELRDFLGQVDAAEVLGFQDQRVFLYHSAIQQGTNDRKSRIERGRIIQEILEASVALPDEAEQQPLA